MADTAVDAIGAARLAYQQAMAITDAAHRAYFDAPDDTKRAHVVSAAYEERSAARAYFVALEEGRGKHDG